MHMTDNMISAAVGTTMAVVSAGAVGYSIKKMNATELNNNRIPVMGVMGAFVFAAQMINFTIPGTGSSGHIGGGILLAALLGPYPAFLAITSVLIIQALFFADGGLLALGCNIFNMGVLTCFVAYPLLYKSILRKIITPKRLAVASVLAVVIGLQLGSFAVVLETTASGIIRLPFTSFLLLMQPIHLVISLIEGVVTGSVLCFIYKARKDILLDALTTNTGTVAGKKVVVIFALATLITGGFLSYFASDKPDGLQWAIQGIIGEQKMDQVSDAQQTSQELQAKTAIMPGYSFKDKEKNSDFASASAGILGGSITLAVTTLTGWGILVIRKRKAEKQSKNESNR